MKKNIIWMAVLLFVGVACQKAPEKTPHLDRAKEMFERVWNAYRVSEYGLFSEYYPNSYKPDLTYFQDSSRKAQKVSFLWPLSGVFSSVNLLAEMAPETYSVYQDSMVKAVEMYYDNQRLPPGYQAYPTIFEKVDRYYDDNGLVGIDYIDAYEVTGKPEYLEKAKEVMVFILSGWDDRWEGAVPWLEGHKDQKPACSNGKALVLALKLYQSTREKEYLEQGIRFYDWMNKYLRDDSLNIVWNALLTEKGEVQKHAYTYNTGTLLQAAVKLYKFTEKQEYLQDARALAEGSYNYYVKFLPDSTPYISDLPWFVTVLFRGYQDLYEVDQNPKYVDAIIASADYAWENARDQSGLIYNDWTGRKEEMKSPKWLLDEACMIEVYLRAAMIRGEIK